MDLKTAMSERQFVAALSALLGEYLAAQPDIDAVFRPLGITLAHVLSVYMRDTHMFPEDMDRFLHQFYQTLRAVTLAIVRDHDADPEGN